MKKVIEKILAAPADILGIGVKGLGKVEREIEKDLPIKKVKRYWKILGPGLTTGAADDDPSGIATYSQMGSSHGFGLLWLSVVSFPLMAVVEEMCARIGLVTGRGLAANIKRHFSKKMLYFSTLLLVFANVFNIGADLGAMAKATQLLVPNANFVFLIFLFAFSILLFEIFIPYKRYSAYLKYLTLALLAYVFSALLVDMPWSEVFSSAILPKIIFNKDEIILICAALGTTISPYLFFWQTSQEIEEEIEKGETTVKLRQANVNHKEIKDMRVDVWSGMLFSNIVMFFIILACGAVLFPNGITNITTAEEAAQALRPFAGDLSYFLFALGILGTGFLAIPVLAGSVSYAVSESLGFKFGLYRKLHEARAFYGVIIIAMLLGIAINFIGIPSMTALIYSAVLNGIISPILLYFIVKISSDSNVMGEYTNNRVQNIFGTIAVCLMGLVSLLTIYFLFQ